MVSAGYDLKPAFPDPVNKAVRLIYPSAPQTAQITF